MIEHTLPQRPDSEWSAISAAKTASDLLDVLEHQGSHDVELLIRLIRLIAKEHVAGELWATEVTLLARRAAKLFGVTVASIAMDLQRARREALAQRADAYTEAERAEIAMLDKMFYGDRPLGSPE